MLPRRALLLGGGEGADGLGELGAEGGKGLLQRRRRELLAHAVLPAALPARQVGHLPQHERVELLARLLVVRRGWPRRPALGASPLEALLLPLLVS